MPVSRRRDIVRRNNEPPEAVLQDLAMAGLVGILRQLGDLAELAADVFQDLHDQVMDASARGRRLAARAKQLEADQDLLVYAAAAAPNTERRLSWHADQNVSHGVVAGGGGGGDVPRFIAECIKQCRGPPGLSILDKYDADGDGACLRRYTDPSFFRRTNSDNLQQDTHRAQAYLRGKEKRPKFQSSEDCNPPKSAHTDSRPETAATTSENASPRFLSMRRHLKHQLEISLKPQPRRNIQKHDESSPQEKASSVDHSEVDISFTSSPEVHTGVDTSTATEKGKENQQGDVQQLQDSVMPNCSDAGGELGRTSSFGAWLAPDFRTPEHDVTEESYRDNCNGILSRDAAHCNGTMNAEQDSVAADKWSKYEGSFELIASRVTSFPFIKQHDPSIDYYRNKKQLEPAQDTGTESITSLNPAESSRPVLEADPVLVIHDSLPETSEQCYLHHENSRMQSTRDLSCECDSSAAAEIQVGPSVLNQGSSSRRPEKCGHPTSNADSNNMINGSPRKSASVKTENSGSEDADLVMPPLPPIPPMQWLSVKVHTGSFVYRKPLTRKDLDKPWGRQNCQVFRRVG